MNLPFKATAVYALTAKAQSDKSNAIASLTVLLEHPAGIGDHSTEDLHRNLNEALTQLDDADSRLETLKKYFPEVKEILKE